MTIVSDSLIFVMIATSDVNVLKEILWNGIK